jgi:uroporphyrinogen decarboxylase
MDSRERFFKAVNHEQPDRPPLYVSLTPQTAVKLAKAAGMPEEPPLDSLLSTRISHMGLLTKLGVDAVGIAACSPDDFPTRELEDGTLVNEWGMRFKSCGLYFEFYEYPLAKAETVEDIEKYTFPDPLAKGRFDAAREAVGKYGEDYAILGDLECAIFETSWYLVGLEKFLMDLAMEKEYIFALMDKVMEVNTEVGIQLIKAGADVIWAGDDFGGQNGMVMNPESWRRIFKPRIQKMFEAFRGEKADIKLAWHSCGSIVPIIVDFIDIGLDILNPIQPMAKGMEPEFLKREFGRDLTFFGGIDLQELMPYGTPQQVKDEVRRRIEILGEGGGYIVAPAHNIQDDTAVENICALFEAVKEAG